MAVPRIALPLISDDPLHVSVTRGGAEESCHAVDVALCDADGSVLVGLGDGPDCRLFRRRGDVASDFSSCFSHLGICGVEAAS